jgi:hypothetical protein
MLSGIVLMQCNNLAASCCGFMLFAGGNKAATFTLNPVTFGGSRTL